MNSSPASTLGTTLALILGLTTAACGDDGNGSANNSSRPGFLEDAKRELVAQGVGKYIGQDQPISETDSEGTTVYEFDSADGPICLYGDKYRTLVRDRGSENLLIFLQGGGACSSSLCVATRTAPTTIPTSGMLSESAENPVADWNVVYVPYCDGSVFSGDNTFEGDNETRYHYGLRNLTAALGVAKSRFPSPKKILLAGTSAGGYGTILGTAVVRLHYEQNELLVFNDSGLGLTNPEDPARFEEFKREWKFDQFIPKSCSECQGQQMTSVVAWGLQNEPSLRVATFSAYEDAVIGDVFLQMEGSKFKSLALEKTGEIQAEYPDRYRRFMVEGTTHTVLMMDETSRTAFGFFSGSEGRTIADWTAAFIDNTPDWVDYTQNNP